MIRDQDDEKNGSPRNAKLGLKRAATRDSELSWKAKRDT
jgi:hypothetical protein